MSPELFLTGWLEAASPRTVPGIVRAVIAPHAGFRQVTVVGGSRLSWESAVISSHHNIAGGSFPFFTSFLLPVVDFPRGRQIFGYHECCHNFSRRPAVTFSKCCLEAHYSLWRARSVSQ